MAFARAFEKGVETAYKAVMKPKEGTILTVAKGAAVKALEIAEDSENLETFFADVIEEAEAVLSRTDVYKRQDFGRGLCIFETEFYR